MIDTQVLIVGAGPVGLTLAVDLGLRGVRCTLVEQKEAPQFLPKMERCNARTMEMFRRMGLADRIRAAGLPAHCPMDVFIVTSIMEPPLLRLPYPSVADAKQEIAASTDATMPLEPYQLISQYTLDKQKAPTALEDLVQAGYLKQLPNDPMTGSNSTWTVDQEDSLMSVDQQDPGISDVHSGATQTSSDGTAYSTW